MTVLKDIINFIFLPIRVMLKTEQVRRLGLIPVVDDRHNAVLKHVKGTLLDIGCGENLLVKQYGTGIGVDVYPWKGIDVLVDTTHLPFPSDFFDTITLIASLNHIPSQIRNKVLSEVKRVLKDDGKVLLTMLTPSISYVGHNFLWRWSDPDLQERGMKEGETWGFTPTQISSILLKSGLRLIHHEKFVYGLNHLYVAQKISL